VSTSFSEEKEAKRLFYAKQRGFYSGQSQRHAGESRHDGIDRSTPMLFGIIMGL
jgi:hypothetical protein